MEPLDELSDEQIARKLDAIEAEPMSAEQIAHIVRSAVNARFCDGCGEDCPYDPERPESWSDCEIGGRLQRYCTICTRRHKAILARVMGSGPSRENCE